MMTVNQERLETGRARTVNILVRVIAHVQN
jgi:hypothetical protein